MLLAEEVAAHQVQVGEAVVVEAAGEPFDEADRVAVDHVVVAVERRQAHADAAAAPHLAHRLEHLEQQAGAVLARAAVGAAALVAAVTQELVEQVAVGAVHLHAVEAGGAGVLGGAREAGDDGRQLVVVQLARHHVGLLALGRVHLVAGDRERARRHRLAAVVEQRVAGAAAVPDLQHDAPAGGMHRVGDLLPAGDLGLGVDAGLVPEGGVALHRHRRLGDQQAGAGALGVVGGHQLAGHVAGFGAAARERGHQDAVGQGELAGLQRGEEIGHGVLSSGSSGSKSRA